MVISLDAIRILGYTQTREDLSAPINTGSGAKAQAFRRKSGSRYLIRV
jgi:hypothetical protein